MFQSPGSDNKKPDLDNTKSEHIPTVTHRVETIEGIDYGILTFGKDWKLDENLEVYVTLSLLNGGNIKNIIQDMSKVNLIPNLSQMANTVKNSGDALNFIRNCDSVILVGNEFLANMALLFKRLVGVNATVKKVRTLEEAYQLIKGKE
jgi:hypothetical protein